MRDFIRLIIESYIAYSVFNRLYDKKLLSKKYSFIEVYKAYKQLGGY